MNLKEAIKTVLQNRQSISDGFYLMYYADGETMTEEDTPLWIILSDEDDSVYEEYSTADEAIDEYLKKINMVNDNV